MSQPVAPDRMPSIVRISPQGVAEWRIPLHEQIPVAHPGVQRTSFQLSAAGRFLALMVRTDSRHAAGDDPPSVVLIDPKANRVVYRGTLAEHVGRDSATAPAATAPAGSR